MGVRSARRGAIVASATTASNGAADAWAASAKRAVRSARRPFPRTTASIDDGLNISQCEFRRASDRARAVCDSAIGRPHGEKSVSQLLEAIDTMQPNMSQHLATLYRAGVLGRRREGTQIRYRLESERVATLCRAVCAQVATEMAGAAGLRPHERLLPRGAR